MPDAPSSPAVALVVWRDARTDPPSGYQTVITDEWLQFYGETRDGRERRWYQQNIMGTKAQPTVWSELPVPPVEGALTLDDLLYAMSEGAYLCDKKVTRLEDWSAREYPDDDPDTRTDAAFWRNRTKRLLRAIADAERGGTM